MRSTGIYEGSTATAVLVVAFFVWNGCGEGFDSDASNDGASSSGAAGSGGAAGEGGNGGDGGGGEGGHEPCDGACSDPTPHCDEASDTCVACLENAHCTNDPSEPICDDGTCRGCMVASECDNACDATGACVECTAVDRTACGENVCDGATNTCTDRPAHSKALCQDCVADEECMEGQLCVLMSFEGTDVGNFCLWRQDAPEGPAGSCTNVQPYRDGKDVTSIDGATAQVCSLRVTTCEALNQFDMQSCDVGTPPAAATDEQCGVSDLDDGLCRVVDAVTNRCTVPCLSDDDCVPGSTCNTGATPRYCNF